MKIKGNKLLPSKTVLLFKIMCSYLDMNVRNKQINKTFLLRSLTRRHKNVTDLFS